VAEYSSLSNGTGDAGLDWLGCRCLFGSSEIPLVVRIAVGAIGVGILIIIGVAIKDRMKKAKTDDFKEVER